MEYEQAKQKLIDKIEYDSSIEIFINNRSVIISKVVAENIKITKV